MENRGKTADDAHFHAEKKKKKKKLFPIYKTDNEASKKHQREEETLRLKCSFVGASFVGEAWKNPDFSRQS